MSELCPKCKVIQNMKVDESEREIVDNEGKKQKITTQSYQCEVCNSFVRSEDSKAE